MWAPETIATIGLVFILAGFVKGTVGFGLPTVSLPLLTIIFGLTDAMALMVVPTFLANVWQAFAGPDLRDVLRRLWPVFAAGVVATWLAVSLLAQWDAAILAGVLGILLCLYAGYALAAPHLELSAGSERWLGPLVGAASGLVTGLTGSMVMPSVPYLQAIGLSRDVLVQAMGVWFALASLVLALSLREHELLSTELATLSVAAVVPATFGMIAGQALRRRISEQRFRLIFLWALFALGLYIVIKALV